MPPHLFFIFFLFIQLVFGSLTESINLSKAKNSLQPKVDIEEEKNANGSLWAIHTMNSMNFYGHWKSTRKGTKTLNNFVNEEGFLILGTMGSFLLNQEYIWYLYLVVHDGNYVDTNSIEIRSKINLTSFVFDHNKLTFSGKNVMLEITSGKNPYAVNEQQCVTDIEISFKDTETEKPYEWERKSTITDYIGTRLNLQSKNCSLNIQSETLKNHYSVSHLQIIVSVAVLVIYIGCGAKVNKGIMTDFPLRINRNMKISLWSLLLVNYYNIYLMLFNFIAASVLNRWFTFVAFLIFAAIVIPEASAVYTVYISDTNFTNPRFTSKHIAIYYVILLSLVSVTISAKSIWLDCISGLFLVPQIIQIFWHGKRFNAPFKFVLLSALTRITLVFYFKIYQDNIHKFSPNLAFAFLYIGFIILSVIVVTIQNWYPRLFFKINRYDYEVALKTSEEKKEPCPICMENLGESSVESKKGLLEEDKQQLTLFETPCKHRFHAKCLKEWMKRKFECPFCKRELPYISIEMDRPRLNNPNRRENPSNDTFSF